MAGFSDLLEVLIGTAVEVGGKGVVHGGKGVMMAGARKIGWAKKGTQRQGKRFAGHSLAKKSLASSGSAGVTKSRLGNYDPKQAYLNQTLNPYAKAMKSGSGVGGGISAKEAVPSHLFGRAGFEKPKGPLGREMGERYVRKTNKAPNSYAKRPRSNIKFK